jgi:hypothetical protein
VDTAVEKFLADRCWIFNDDRTWRDWFRHTLAHLVAEPGAFTGKRPGCNSGWQEYLQAALHEHLDAGIVTTWEEDTEDPRLPCDVNWGKYRAAFQRVLDHVFPLPSVGPGE